MESHAAQLLSLMGIAVAMRPKLKLMMTENLLLFGHGFRDMTGVANTKQIIKPKDGCLALGLEYGSQD